MEKVQIGDAVIVLDEVGSDREGRTVWGYSIRLDGVNPTHQARDLKSGCQGGTEREGMESLLGFLTAAAEAYGYQLRTGRESDNADLFPKEVVEWAYQNSDEISLREIELREEREEKATTVPYGYEVWHDSDMEDEDGNPMPAGWYWWACFPGCLPDGDAMGPFKSEREAIADLREGLDG